MKRFTIVAILFAMALAICVADADARRRGRRRGGSPSASGIHHNTVIDPLLQVVAQKRADEMARLGSCDHNIHNYQGATCPDWHGPKGADGRRAYGEGIGPGGPLCGTCVVGSTCVTDAHAYSERGRGFRVRLWR